MAHDSIDGLAQYLDKLPDILEGRRMERRLLIDGVRRGDLAAGDKLRRQVVEGKAFQKSLDRLMASLKNAAPALAKYAKDSEKDDALLLEMVRKSGKSGFDKNHKIYRAQADAVDDVEQKLKFAMRDLRGLRDVIDKQLRAVQLDRKMVDQLNKLARDILSDLQVVEGSLPAIADA